MNAEQQRKVVICPNCVHRFRAIPEDVQSELAALREALEQIRNYDMRFDDPAYAMVNIADAALNQPTEAESG